MFYFAYGSNMLFDQMRERCPSATFVCAASLEGHRLAFTRNATNPKSRWHGFGVADVVPAEKSRVWGAVFQIDERDISALDVSEGYHPDRERNAHRRVEMNVARGGDTGKSLLAHVYLVCEREELNPIPHRDYVGSIVAGARMWGLPVDYIQDLEGIEVKA